MQYEVAGSIEIEPIWWKDPPLVNVGLDQGLLWEGRLTTAHRIPLHCDLDAGTHSLSICLLNKQDNDTDVGRGLDKAVVIKSLEFFGISDSRFIYTGEYRPLYNQHWVAEQQLQGTPPATVLRSHTYLGWNGTWKLEFSVPVFTWIHQLQSLGWIYD